MTTILRADENRLKRQAISRLPEIKAIRDGERYKLNERRTIEGTVVETIIGDSDQDDHNSGDPA
jgi:hypothetical protein